MMLVVYGTLMPGMPGWNELGLAGRLRPVRTVLGAGAMFDLGAYPGLVLSEPGSWIGRLCEAIDPTVLADMDRFEGLGRAGSRSDPGFRRSFTTLADGTRALVYEYVGPTAGFDRVPGGDWSARWCARLAQAA